MEGTNIYTLPMIGKVLRGSKDGKKLNEFNYFVAKTKVEQMQSYINKFDELYKGKNTIEIQFVDDRPFTVKNARYNQSGLVCSSYKNSNIARENSKEGVREIPCNKDCKYLVQDGKGKCACNPKGWLKFLIPKISMERIWLMEVRSRYSITNLESYFEFQKRLGNSIEGLHTLFLKPQDIPDPSGNIFKHYVLDIIKSENFIPSSKSENLESLSTINNQNVEKPLNNKSEQTPNDKTQIQETKNTSNEVVESKKVSKNTNTKQKSTKTLKEKQKTSTKTDKEVLEEKTEQKESINLDNCYMLISTFNKKLKLPSGQEKDYLIGEFYDMQDKRYEIAIKPKDAEELIKCDNGTAVNLEIKKVENINFALSIKYIEKCLKNKVAA